MKKYWALLFVAAFLEVLWVIGLAHAHNFWQWFFTIILIILSNYFMIKVTQVLPTGTVYAVFVGLGSAGTVISEILFFGEPLNWIKLLLILVLLIGVIGLKLITDAEKNTKESL